MSDGYHHHHHPREIERHWQATDVTTGGGGCRMHKLK